MTARLDPSFTRAAVLLGGGDAEVRQHYRNDPVGFTNDMYDWRHDELRAPYQDEAMGKLPAERRVSVRGPHGLGKTAMAAWVINWFVFTRDGVPGRDWKVITTASAWRQLTHFLWPEIRKWLRRLDYEALGRPPLIRNQELLAMSIKLATGEAFAVASDVPEKIEGAHADDILYVFDESKIIPEAIFDAAEGALSIGDAYALAISTPGEPQGRFYQIHKRMPGTEDWWVRHVTRDEAIKAGRMDQKWADDRRRQWGEESAVYINRVLGEFATAEEDGVIPLRWVEAATTRWDELYGDGKRDDLPAFRNVGCDIADTGDDDTVLAIRHGHHIVEQPSAHADGTGLRYYATGDTMTQAGRIAGVIEGNAQRGRPQPDGTETIIYRGKAIVDVIGIGAGVVARLKEQYGESRVFPFNAAKSTKRRDGTDELGFTNVRSAAWWNMREMLDPANEFDIALPPDERLIGDLTAPKFRVMSGGNLQVESKDDIKKRLGRSTDAGDAVIQSFWDVGDDVFVWADDTQVTRSSSPWDL
jgi:hypothetical protein